MNIFKNKNVMYMTKRVREYQKIFVKADVDLFHTSLRLAARTAGIQFISKPGIDMYRHMRFIHITMTPYAAIL